MNKIKVPSIAALVFLFTACQVYRYSPDISIDDLHQHLRYLSSDDLQGRYPGTPGDVAAGRYIEGQYKKLHIPFQYQEFTFVKSYTRGKNNMLMVDDQRIGDSAFAPVIFTTDTFLSAPVVFAGYGIQTEVDSFKWDDFEGLNVKDKWVMVLKGVPDLRESIDWLSMGSDDRDKAMLARDQGAAGIVFVSGNQADPQDKLPVIAGKQASAGIAAIQVTRPVADRLLQPVGTSIQQLEARIQENRRSVGLELSARLSARTDLESITGKTGNWIGLIEGADPVLKNEYLVIGAHYDHLGMGGPGSSSRRPDTTAVHNGADDNASGVSAMLELGGMLKKNQQLLKRTVLLIAFGGEEMGLLGSKYFVNNPTVSLHQIDAMVNLDMVGRLDTMKGIQIGGTGTSREADSLIRLSNLKEPFRLLLSREGSGPSDHSSFYGKDIPVFFISTGAHTDYHTPDDDLDKINFPGLQAVTEFTYRLMLSIDRDAGGLTFQEAGPRDAPTTGARFKVTLGFMPDFSATDVEGVRVDFVSKGKAAERGGIKNGDIITAIDGLAINNIYDYMYRLSKLSKNQIISVEVLRNGQKEIMIIQL